jgi:NAD dependent epimerase/dehydratase family enzyme
MVSIAITGSSGLIGTAFRKAAESRGDRVLRVLRGNPSDPAALWDPAAGWFRLGAL